MSILNVLFQDTDTAYVGVDSEVRQIGQGEFYDSNKLFIIPCASTVLACRGEQTLARWATSELLRITGGQDFDVMEAALPLILSRCHADMIKHAAPGFDFEAEDAQLTMVGYSPTAKRVICVHAYRPVRQREFKVEHMENGVVSPDPEAQIGPVGGRDFFAVQSELATLQVRTWKAKQPGSAIGGRLVVAKVSKDEIQVRNLGA